MAQHFRDVGGRRQPTVLVVDDDPASRSFLAEALEAFGCRTLEAGDGGEALRVISEHLPHLVCTDLMMPGMDGLEFLRLARTYVPDLPLVLITGCGEAEAAGEALRCGAVGFLRKPVSLAELRALVERLPSWAGGEGASRDAGQLVNSSNGRAGENGAREQAGDLTARPIGQLTPARSSVALDPALLRKATQLSFLTRFGSTLRDAAGAAPANGRTGGASVASLVDRSLNVVLRALPGDQAVLALTDGPEVQPIAALGLANGPPRLDEVVARIRGADGHPWHGILNGIPWVAAPLTIQGETVGAICVGRSPGSPAFSWAEGELLAAFSAQTALSLENACLGRQLERAFQETVTSLVVTLEARDGYTEGHSLRVAGYTTVIAEGMGLPPAMREQIRTASLLHDLGKVGVRDAILNKPGSLTPEEWAAMRQHPVLGWRILSPLGFLAAEAQSVKHHHERFDGKGYPDGLAGEAIPLPARIIAVADAFDAMTTARPYRPPMPPAEALAELRRKAGTQFDPRPVEAFHSWAGGRTELGRAANLLSADLSGIPAPNLAA
jgi:response regulator RpfG family c-di-GMP phosphodiesterase